MEWGKTDCFLLAVDALQVLTGVDCDKIDAKKQFRGKYKTMRQAYRLLKRYSGGGLAQTFQMYANLLGIPIVSPSFAGRGDLALLDIATETGGMREAMGVVTGQNIIAQGKSGLISVPLNQAIKTWKV